MIGMVVVSHSAKLAEGVCELARQVGQGRVRIAAAGGTADPENPIGTDAFQVLQAIESVYSEDGVLVLMDLGSAVLSAETALEMLGEEKSSRVELCGAPLVEGAVAAATLGGAGASLAEMALEARNALAGKLAGESACPTKSDACVCQAQVTLTNRLGLHARPAAQIVRLARRYRAQVTIDNVAASSINGVLSLRARQGHQLRICAQGAEAREAVAALVGFIESGCGEMAREEPVAQAGGIAASAGIAIGPLVKLRHAAAEIAARAIGNPEAERQRLMAAVHGAQEETRALYEWSKAHIGEDEAGIFDAQSLFLEDPELAGAVSRRLVEDRVGAESAWQAETAKLADRIGFRAADVADVAARVLRRLTGQAGAARVLREPAILSAHDLAPSEVKDFDPAMVLGLCLEAGERQRTQRDSGAGHGDSRGGGTGSGRLRTGRWNHCGRGWRTGNGLDFARCGPGCGARRPPPGVAGRAPRGGVGAAQTRGHARWPPHTGFRQHQRCGGSRGSRGLRRRGGGCAAHGVSVPGTRGRARRRGTTGRLSRHRRVAGRASADRPHARHRRRQASALRGNRRRSQSLPRLARHPRDVEPARPVSNAAPRHPAGGRRAAGRVAVADDRFP